MERIYNKLVRDNIPDVIVANGEEAFIRVLNDDEYRNELEAKLGEEYQEVLMTTTSDERVEELADMVEVIMALASVEGKSFDDILEVAKVKRKKRGGFEKKIFLEKVIENN